MSGGFRYSADFAERLAEIERRAEKLIAECPNYMGKDEAYMRVYAELEHEAWQALETSKLNEIRDLGT
jgi:hypothetical protein